MENFGIVNLLTSVLDREYSVINCLPIYLQELMNEVESNISSVYAEVVGRDYIMNFDKQCYDFLDMVTLYQELNYMSRDLGICTLLLPNNVKIEDANSNVIFIMKKMAEQDCVFKYCYNNGKRRVLK